jgi:hypothetical protein
VRHDARTHVPLALRPTSDNETVWASAKTLPGKSVQALKQLRQTGENRSAAARIEALDTTIFAIQPGHYADRTSFLRVQRLIRTLEPGYQYMEIGSDLGASLLPHLLDPNCGGAVSIDPRPELQSDERGTDFHYPGNSTLRMLAELGKYAEPIELRKLTTIEADASAVGATRSGIRPHLVLIDGEHTNVAAFSDFLASLSFIADNAIITFHDANLIGDTLQIIERLLLERQTRYIMVILPSCVAVVGLGDCIRAVEADLSPYAEPKDAYFTNARRHRHRAVADAVIGRSEGLRGRDVAELTAWTMDIENRLAAAEVISRRMPDQLKAANADLIRLQSVLARVELAAAAKQEHLDALTNSTSWKVTAPMRAAARLLKGRRT